MPEITQNQDSSSFIQPGFMVIQGNQLEQLRQLIVDWFNQTPLAPLENEVILVQSNGIAQWLKLALAKDSNNASSDIDSGIGISAALDVTLPARFLWRCYQAILENLPSASPFDKAPLTWRLMRILHQINQLPETDAQYELYQPLRQFMAEDQDQRRLYQLAAQLSDLFDQYQVYRSDWLSAWSENRDELPDGLRDLIREIPQGQEWQPALWRQLIQDIEQQIELWETQCLISKQDELSGGIINNSLINKELLSRSNIHQAFIVRAKQLFIKQRPKKLPRRVIVFGISSLPQQMLEALEAISHLTQVVLCVHNPCQHFWGDLIEGKELFRQNYKRMQAKELPKGVSEEDMHLYGHPLLAAWGKQGRDYIRLLDERDERSQYETHFNQANLKIDLFESPVESLPDQSEPGLLQQIQDDIFELRPISERRSLACELQPAQDTSLVFHIAHSPLREVEILYDQLLAEFNRANGGLGLDAKQKLRPRDILVMVPDINRYAPHIKAVFGRISPDDKNRFIPFAISDQGQRHSNPMMAGLETLFRLPESRINVSDVLTLLEVPALANRLGINQNDLPKLKQWIEGANIRWGLDHQHRAPFGIPEDLTQNSWYFGLKRMLLGYMNGTTEWHEIEPYSEIGGLEAALIGPLAQLIQLLDHYNRLLSKDHPPKIWAQLIQQMIADFFQASNAQDTTLLTNLTLALENWLAACELAALEQTLPLFAVRESLLTGIDQPSLTQKFLGGSVNFATLMPMRAIPFKQVYLLGMNDGDYPRSRKPTDFDLMASDYRPGDRSRREDDRYLFLEAMLSAREKLYISWVGRSIRDNTERPPSVLVGQLRDHIAAGWHLAGEVKPERLNERRESGERLLDALTTEHPLQPFSKNYFADNRNPRLFTYASEWRQMHNPQESAQQELSLQAQTAALPFVLPEGGLNLKQLSDFLKNPVKFFYHHRLKVNFFAEDLTSADEERFGFNALEQWQLTHQMISELTQQLYQAPRLNCDHLLQQLFVKAERSGQLPMGPFAEVVKKHLFNELLPALQSYQQARLPLLQLDAVENIHLTIQSDELVALSGIDSGEFNNGRSSVNGSTNDCENDPANTDVNTDTVNKKKTASESITLNDQVSGLLLRENGSRVQLLMETSTLPDAKTRFRWHVLLRYWVQHLAAQLAAPTETRIISVTGDLSLQPMNGEQAALQLKRIMAQLTIGLNQPLPLPCKTAIATLFEGAKPQEVYEGNYMREGEINSHSAFARFWPDFLALQHAQIESLADTIYGSLIGHDIRINDPEDNL